MLFRSDPRHAEPDPRFGCGVEMRNCPSSPWDPPGGAYVYAPDRKPERPITHLAGFKGVLQVDGYAGYRALAERGDVDLAFCWTYVRQCFSNLDSQSGSISGTEDSSNSV